MDSKWAVCVVMTLVLMVQGIDAQEYGQAFFGLGNRTSDNSPWLASLSNMNGTFCGGSLINSEWVLTTAECFTSNNTEGWIIYLGWDDNSTSEVFQNITEIVIHPDYDSVTNDNALALVKLAFPVNFTDSIQPVCLAAENSTFYNGTDSWATFWNHSINFEPTNHTIMEEEVTVLGTNECDCFIGGNRITENMLCTSFQQERNTSWELYQGGPLVSSEGSAWVQSGVLIFGDACNEEGDCVGVYTRVSQYESWINSTIYSDQASFVLFNSTIYSDQASFVLFNSSLENNDLDFVCNVSFFNSTTESPTTDLTDSTSNSLTESASTPSQPPQFICGQAPLNNCILGGEDVSGGSWPWQVSLNYDWHQFCGGSLINQQWILTAAECFHSTSTEGLFVYLGRQSQGVVNENEVSQCVLEIIVHPNYNPTTHENDLALVKLCSAVEFTDYIQPVCLAARDSSFYGGTHSWVTGWGTIGGNVSSPQFLHEGKVPVMGNSECNCALNNADMSVTDNMICAGSQQGGRDSCQGDLGAPLVTNQGPAWVQSGVLSFCEGCAPPHSPAVYTRVSQYECWIQSQVQDYVGFVKYTSDGFDWDSFYICGDRSIFSGTPQLSFSLSLLLTLSPLLLSLYVFS